MDNKERLSHLKFVHKFDNGLINFMAILSIFYLFFMVFELYKEEFSATVIGLVYVDTFICIIFMFDFFYFMFKANNKWMYFKNYYLDFLASLPFMLLIWISPQLALLNLFKVLRGFKSIIKIYEFVGKKQLSKVLTVFILFFLVVLYFSIIVIHFEKSTNAGFHDFQDGLWWAVSTITTVGYGDVVPVTTYGKIAAMLLMLFGIGITSALGAILVSSLLKPSQEKMMKEEEVMVKLEQDIENKQQQLSNMETTISNKLDTLERKIDTVLEEEKKRKTVRKEEKKKKSRRKK
jgi:voltage-gated potassium channel